MKATIEEVRLDKNKGNIFGKEIFRVYWIYPQDILMCNIIILADKSFFGKRYF